MQLEIVSKPLQHHQPFKVNQSTITNEQFLGSCSSGTTLCLPNTGRPGYVQCCVNGETCTNSSTYKLDVFSYSEMIPCLNNGVTKCCQSTESCDATGNCVQTTSTPPTPQGKSKYKHK